MAEIAEADLVDHSACLAEEQQAAIDQELPSVNEISAECVQNDATLPPSPSTPSPVCSQDNSDDSDEGFGSISVCENEPETASPIAESELAISGSPFAGTRSAADQLSAEAREMEADSRDESPKPAPAQIASPTPKQQGGTEHELRKFGLSAQDKVLESYSCALYPKKGLLAHGRIFITQHFVAFSGWKDMRVLLPMRSIMKIEKTNTLLYIPNALSLTMEDKSEYFFGSFIDRDACVQMLKNLVEIERRILEIHGNDVAISSRGLEFGYQTRQASVSRITGGSLSLQSFLMGSDKSANSSAASAAPAVAVPAAIASATTGGPAAAPAVAVAGTAAPAVPPTSPPSASAPSAAQAPPSSSALPVSASSPSTNKLGAPFIPRFLMGTAASDSSKVDSIAESKEKERSTPPGPLTFSELLSTASDREGDGAAVSAKEPSVDAALLDTQIDSASYPIAADPVAVDDSPPPAPRVDLSSLTGSSSVHWLWSSDMQNPVQHLWKPCWLYGCGYGDFLREEEALELKYSEWTPFQGNVEEDVFSKLKFRFSREFTFSFPRTTMLMFGPKFAPIKQMQYLFVPDDVDSFRALEKSQPQQAVVLFVTKFEGIPMADVFKVLQYWVIDQSGSQGDSLHIQVGVAIHYVKSSMFKTQILSGTKEEVAGQLKKYAQFAQLRASSYSRALSQEGLKEPSIDGRDGESTGKRSADSSFALSDNASHPMKGIAEIAATSGAATAATARTEYLRSAAKKAEILEMDGSMLLGSSLRGKLALCLALLLLVLVFSSWRRIALLETKVDELQKTLLETNKLLASILHNQGSTAT